MAYQRTHRAFRIAYLSDCDRITYADNLRKFVHSCFWMAIIALAPSARTVLTYLAALHRAGKYGYLGCALAYEILAPKIAEATGRPCSERTLERGVRLLKGAGLIAVHRWTIPDQQFELHNGQTITVKGTQRVQTKDGSWRCLQIAILVLTPRSIAFWEKSSDRRKKRGRPTAKVAANLNDDSVVLQTTRNIGVCPNSESSCDSQGATDQGGQGNSTWPDSSSLTGEQCHDRNKGQSRPKDCPSLDGDKRLASSEAQFSKRGCSAPRPKFPRMVRWRNTWENASQIILNSLHACLCNFSTREADSIYDRARFELSRQNYDGWPTSIDWSYWVGHWKKYSGPQRKYHMRRDILPILKAGSVVTPHEAKRLKNAAIEQKSDRVFGLEESEDRAIRSGNRALINLIDIAKKAIEKSDKKKE